MYSIILNSIKIVELGLVYDKYSTKYCTVLLVQYETSRLLYCMIVDCTVL